MQMDETPLDTLLPFPLLKVLKKETVSPLLQKAANPTQIPQARSEIILNTFSIFKVGLAF